MSDLIRLENMTFADGVAALVRTGHDLTIDHGYNAEGRTYTITLKSGDKSATGVAKEDREALVNAYLQLNGVSETDLPGETVEMPAEEPEAADEAADEAAKGHDAPEGETDLASEGM